MEGISAGGGWGWGCHLRGSQEGGGGRAALSHIHRPPLPPLSPIPGLLIWGPLGPTPIPSALLGPTPQGISEGRLDCEGVGSPNPRRRPPDTGAASSILFPGVLAAFRDRLSTGRASGRGHFCQGMDQRLLRSLGGRWRGRRYTGQGRYQAGLRFPNMGTVFSVDHGRRARVRPGGLGGRVRLRRGWRLQEGLGEQDGDARKPRWWGRGRVGRSNPETHVIVGQLLSPPPGLLQA